MKILAYKEHGAHHIYSDQGYRKGKRPMFNADPIDELSPLNYQVNLFGKGVFRVRDLAEWLNASIHL